MTTSQTIPQKTPSSESTTSQQVSAPDDVFVDPVAYLAEFGIDSELITETTLPAAA